MLLELRDSGKPPGKEHTIGFEVLSEGTTCTRTVLFAVLRAVVLSPFTCRLSAAEDEVALLAAAVLPLPLLLLRGIDDDEEVLAMAATKLVGYRDTTLNLNRHHVRDSSNRDLPSTCITREQESFMPDCFHVCGRVHGWIRCIRKTNTHLSTQAALCEQTRFSFSQQTNNKHTQDDLPKTRRCGL
jgi:hypothetical protein